MNRAEVSETRGPSWGCHGDAAVTRQRWRHKALSPSRWRPSVSSSPPSDPSRALTRLYMFTLDIPRWILGITVIMYNLSCIGLLEAKIAINIILTRLYLALCKYFCWWSYEMYLDLKYTVTHKIPSLTINSN